MTTEPTTPSRVDFHHHMFPSPDVLKDFHFDLTSMFNGSGWTIPPGNAPWTPELSVAFMDSLHIKTAILSMPNDMEQQLPATDRPRFARAMNTASRHVVEDHPGRFGFFAHLPTPTDVDAALEEVAYALDELHADGVTLTNVYGSGADARSLGDDLFDPLWAELDRRHALVFIHGEQTPGSNPFPTSTCPPRSARYPTKPTKPLRIWSPAGKSASIPTRESFCPTPAAARPSSPPGWPCCRTTWVAT